MPGTRKVSVTEIAKLLNQEPRGTRSDPEKLLLFRRKMEARFGISRQTVNKAIHYAKLYSLPVRAVDVYQVARLTDEGYTKVQIARMLYCSQDVINAARFQARDMGILEPNWYLYRRPMLKRKVAKLWNKGCALLEISDLTGVPPGTLGRMICEARREGLLVGKRVADCRVKITEDARQRWREYTDWLCDQWEQSERGRPPCRATARHFGVSERVVSRAMDWDRSLEPSRVREIEARIGRKMPDKETNRRRIAAAVAARWHGKLKQVA